MGDTFNTVVIIYDYPPARAAEITDLLNYHGLHTEWGYGPGVTAVERFVNYTDDQGRGSMPYKWGFAGELAELDATFTVQAEAKYEFDGTVTCFAPDLGWFMSTGNQDGTVVFTVSEVQAMIDGAFRVGKIRLRKAVTQQALQKILDQASGVAWQKRIAELTAKYGDTP